jgi:hypothetical protein
MPSSAEEVTQAQEDVERITGELYEAFMRWWDAPNVTWRDAPEDVRTRWCAMTTELLHRDVIRVGRRPQRGERPMTGQTSLGYCGETLEER